MSETLNTWMRSILRTNANALACQPALESGQEVSMSKVERKRGQAKDTGVWRPLIKPGSYHK